MTEFVTWLLLRGGFLISDLFDLSGWVFVTVPEKYTVSCFSHPVRSLAHLVRGYVIMC